MIFVEKVRWIICGLWTGEWFILLALFPLKRFSRKGERLIKTFLSSCLSCWSHFSSAVSYIIWIIDSKTCLGKSRKRRGRFIINSLPRLYRQLKWQTIPRLCFFPICLMISARPWMQFWDLRRFLPEMRKILTRWESTQRKSWRQASICWVW